VGEISPQISHKEHGEREEHKEKKEGRRGTKTFSSPFVFFVPLCPL
jgi:hypothetical protein